MNRTACGALHRFAFRVVLAAVLAFGAASSQALVFKENPVTGEIDATGPIELGDAEKLAEILTLEFRQRHRNVRGLITVNLDSPGGSALGGFRLGYALRELATHTNVRAGGVCLSACALAFLGGRARTVEGRYGVHAASMPAAVLDRAHPAVLLDTVQRLGALATTYAIEMTGKPDVAVRGLSTAAQDMALLTDVELVDMGVITLARRSSQFGRTGFKCPDAASFDVLAAICKNLDIAAMDHEMNVLYRNIQAEGAPVGLSAEQERWRRFRNSCIHDGSPNGYASIVQCVRTAYAVRNDQLRSVWLGMSARKAWPASTDWAPIQPTR